MNLNGWKKALVVALAACLLIAITPLSVLAAKPTGDTLQASMEYLVEQCGQRLYGTPNEDKAAAYVKAQYEKYGYKNVELAKVPLRSTGYTGRLVFKDGSADILGNPYPANPTIGVFDKLEGKLIDLGTDAAYAVPDAASGKIVGAIRFDGAPSLAKVNEIIADISQSPDVVLTGLLITRSGGTLSNQNTVPTISGANAKPSVPCVTTPLMFFETALKNSSNFAFGERYERTKTSAVIATKPAPKGDPDLIILVTSHVDCVLASPGASDNASGVAANLELARRFAGVNLGNIEVRFAVGGAEEGGGMLGSAYLRDSLSAAEKAIAIDMNMDMLCSPSKTSDGRVLNAVSMDINPSPLAFNLPAYLVTDKAKTVAWADGIDNVRIFRYGSSDHTIFANAGIDSASMIVVTDVDDEIEYENHKALDTLMGNYSYERLLMCTNLMDKGIKKAADQKLTKRAELDSKVAGKKQKVSLQNASQIFKTFNKVEITLKSEKTGETKTLTYTQKTPFQTDLTDALDYKVTGVTAYGSGVADNKDAARNAQYMNFKTNLVPVVN